MAVRTNEQVKQAEDALAIEKERLAVITRLIDNSVVVTDTYGKIVLINSSAENLTGWTEQEAMGKHFGEVFHIVDEGKQPLRTDLVERVLKAGGIVDSDDPMTLTAKDGTELLVTNNGAPVYNRHSNIVGVVLVFRNVTERQQAEANLLKIQKLESMGVLAGGIAHDFNNILTGIMGNISLAKMDMAPGDQNFERLVRAERASSEAKNLTQQLLTFSKGGTPTAKVTSIVGLLRESASFVLRGSNVKCEFSIPDDLWPVEVDEGQIGQVINNMLINADQAMPAGGTIEIHAENTIPTPEDAPLLGNKRYVKISIKDHGIGIPEGSLQKIFTPYFTTKQSGSGLGLAVSHSIVRNHGGHIDVESQMGVGTTFLIYLPASLEETVTEKKAEEQLFVGNEKILVMDDDGVVRELAREMLNNIGYRVIVARNGDQAIDLYAKAEDSGSPFDAAIVDLTVPGGMGGREAIVQLLKIDPEAKVIVSSGYSNDPMMTDFRAYGFSGAIAKPYRVKELSKTLYNVINQDDSPE